LVVSSSGYKQLLERLGVAFELIEEIGAPPVQWLAVGKTARRQGWKLHLSSHSEHTDKLIALAVPVLREFRACFKVIASLEAARAINTGEAGLSQVGKIITVYPDGDDEAVCLAASLAAALPDHPAPVIDNELRIHDRAPIFARYGVFSGRHRTKIGIYTTTLVDREGAKSRMIVPR
jgi:hypothetical protein